MDYYQNPKVIGAFLIGFALVGGAYLISNFGKPHSQPASLQVAVSEAPVRVFIPVSDSNIDGVEDWRDQFVQAPAVDITNVATLDYTPPTTLTGQVGVSLMENLVRIKAGGPVAISEEKIVKDTVDKMSNTVAVDKLYDVKDVLINPARDDTTIRVYANSLAKIILEYNIPDLEAELTLLYEHLNNKRPGAIEDLEKLAGVYKNYRDNTLITPVPQIFLKEHLDLINVYSAIYADIKAMALADADPLVTHVRLKRYEEDAMGLYMAISNMYDAILPYATLFAADDPAIVFVKFYQAGP